MATTRILIKSLYLKVFINLLAVAWYVQSFSLQPPLSSGGSVESSELVILARSHLERNETEKAQDLLNQACSQGGISTPGVLSCFRELFEKRISMLIDTDPAGVAIERIGLASLFCDQGRYSDAVQQLKAVMIDGDATVLPKQLQDKASAMLFRTQSAICDWEDYYLASDALAESVESAIAVGSIPAVHPFESLMIPCLTLEMSTSIAKIYARRAIEATTNSMIQPKTLKLNGVDVFSSSNRPIKIGYISPDFTGRHPLAFLLQDMFRFHDKSRFHINLYSVFEEADGSPEVTKIFESVDKWTVLPAWISSQTAAQMIREDGVDILVDLCGYTGTSFVAEVMAHRPASLQIAYMGFPGSSGAPFIDYMICDQVVVPNCYRHHYTESLIFMPHSYFVNSHMFLRTADRLDRAELSRRDYGLPDNGFVFCCHSRPDKIDPVTFTCWIRTVKAIRDEGVRNGNPRQAEACLWLLRSDPEMEQNIRAAAGVTDDCGRLLVLAEKVPRDEHLQRLQLADLFLDTPSYGAHTVGCDCISAGVPLLTLLRDDDFKVNTKGSSERDVAESILTEKLASRVGASLIKALGEEPRIEKYLIVSSMEDYELVMVRAARDDMWFSSIRERVESCSIATPLFDTKRWVKNMEQGVLEAWDLHLNGEEKHDIYITEK